VAARDRSRAPSIALASSADAGVSSLVSRAPLLLVDLEGNSIAGLRPKVPYFMQLCVRRGYKMAIVAVAHRLCRVLYAPLRHGTEFQATHLGVEEGAFTYTVTRQYRLPPKPPGRLRWA
jgi:hypothetical protein